MTEYNSLSVYRGDLFDSLTRYGLGWDRFFDSLNPLLDTAVGSSNYPPYNIVDVGDSKYQIEMAVAGFKESELSIETKQNRLTVSGTKDKKEEKTYRFQGLASRAFSRTFVLPEHLVVCGAALKDGILTIDLKYVVPEELKPKQIPIKTQ
jgi:molecular chaperone IbpA